MPRDITVTLYQFAELSPKAKGKARDWYREASAEDTDYADVVIEDAQRVAEILGITIDTHTVKTTTGKTWQEPSIYWSLDYSHHPYAAFDGRYSYAKGCQRKIRQYAPEDAVLHQLADRLEAAQAPYGYRLTARIDSSRRDDYGDVIVYHNDDEIDVPGVEEILNVMRDFQRWIHRCLEAEYDSRQTDDYIDEQIEANEYEFTEDGERYV